MADAQYGHVGCKNIETLTSCMVYSLCSESSNAHTMEVAWYRPSHLSGMLRI